jgi:hypothetical protein
VAPLAKAKIEASSLTIEHVINSSELQFPIIPSPFR